MQIDPMPNLRQKVIGELVHGKQRLTIIDFKINSHSILSKPAEHPDFVLLYKLLFI